MAESPTPEPYRYQRWGTGIISACCLLIGLVLFLEDHPDRQFVCGMFVRVGLLLGAIWLAWPQLAILPKRLSPLAAGIVLAVLFLAASRPKLFPLLIGLIAVTWVANAVLRRFSRLS